MKLSSLDKGIEGHIGEEETLTSNSMTSSSFVSSYKNRRGENRLFFLLFFDSFVKKPNSVSSLFVDFKLHRMNYLCILFTSVSWSCIHVTLLCNVNNYIAVYIYMNETRHKCLVEHCSTCNVVLMTGV